jgi:hypothetical protein
MTPGASRLSLRLGLVAASLAIAATAFALPSREVFSAGSGWAAVLSTLGVAWAAALAVARLWTLRRARLELQASLATLESSTQAPAIIHAEARKYGFGAATEFSDRQRIAAAVESLGELASVVALVAVMATVLGVGGVLGGGVLQTEVAGVVRGSLWAYGGIFFIQILRQGVRGRLAGVDALWHQVRLAAGNRRDAVCATEAGEALHLLTNQIQQGLTAATDCMSAVQRGTEELRRAQHAMQESLHQYTVRLAAEVARCGDVTESHAASLHEVLTAAAEVGAGRDGLVEALAHIREVVALDQRHFAVAAEATNRSLAEAATALAAHLAILRDLSEGVRKVQLETSHSLAPLAADLHAAVGEMRTLNMTIARIFDTATERAATNGHDFRPNGHPPTRLRRQGLPARE